MSAANPYGEFHDEDLNNKNIQLNNDQKKPKPSFLNKMVDKKEDIIASMVVNNANKDGDGSSSTEEISNSVMKKVNTHLK